MYKLRIPKKTDGHNELLGRYYSQKVEDSVKGILQR